MESRTTAPTSTRTPGDRTELTTVPLMTQPCEMRLRWTCAVAPTRAGAGVDDPFLVVQVELHAVVEQGEVRLPVRLDRPDVLPIAVEVIAVDAGARVEHRRDDVPAEVDPVLAEPAAEGLLREDVHAHGGKVALRLLGLLLPVDDAIRLVEGEDAHPAGVAEGHVANGDRHVGALAAVGGDERLVVHLVDVVAGEDEDRVRRIVLDHVDVLEDRVGCPAIPLGDAAAGDIRLEELHAALVAVEIPRPAETDMVVQRARVVLGQDNDVVDVRIDAVRQGEVDDPVLPPERDGRLGPDSRQDRQALTLTASEDDRHRPLHRSMLARVSSTSRL